ncbi:MAG: hypothetical protein U0L26_07865, partial [Cellulosilyticum sp.]|nr:hypothetical protein [Cellulosilyticum sp.]
LMLIVLFVTFTNSFQSYFVKYTQEIMINQAKSIATEYYEVGRSSQSKEAALDKILPHIQMMNGYLEATTWVVDQYGDGYIVSRDAIKSMSDDVVVGDTLDEVFSGQVIGVENGFKESFSTPVLTIGYPITLNGQVQYALFIHTPMPYILQTIDEVRNLILNVVGFVGSIVFIWIYTL